MTDETQTDANARNPTDACRKTSPRVIGACGRDAGHRRPSLDGPDVRGLLAGRRVTVVEPTPTEGPPHD